MTALLVLTLMVYDCSRELTLIYMIGAVMTLTWTTWRTTLKTFQTYEKEIKVTARPSPLLPAELPVSVPSALRA